MSILARIENVRKVWELLIPHVSTPSDTWLAKWCAGFADEVIEHALSKTAKKFRDATGVSAESAHRYATATMRHRAEELCAPRVVDAATAPYGAAVRR